MMGTTTRPLSKTTMMVARREVQGYPRLQLDSRHNEWGRS
jgi:hypothetical protein